MQKFLACLALILSSCSDLDTGDVDQEVGTGSAAGRVACWQPANPTATCAVPSMQVGPPSPAAARCVWSPSVGFTGFCRLGSLAGYGETSCDGPEDCGGGYRCCEHAVGGVFASSCQLSWCTATGIYDPNHVQLCHSTSDCLIGLSCVASGPPNHSGLPQGLGICK